MFKCERCGKVAKRRKQAGFDLCSACHKEALAEQGQLWKDIAQYYHDQGAHLCMVTMQSK